MAIAQTISPKSFQFILRGTWVSKPISWHLSDTYPDISLWTQKRQLAQWKFRGSRFFIFWLTWISIQHLIEIHLKASEALQSGLKWWTELSDINRALPLERLQMWSRTDHTCSSWTIYLKLSDSQAKQSSLLHKNTPEFTEWKGQV